MCEIDKRKANQIYQKSLEVLKTVQLTNGGCLASTSKNRYPYIYPRDQAYIILAYISANMFENAKKAIEFILKAQLTNGAFPQRYDKNGKDASYKPIQLDGSGLILYALIKYFKKTKDTELIKKYDKNIHKAINYIKSNFHKEKKLLYSPNAIHEFPPHEKGYEIFTNAVCAGALLNINNLSDAIVIPDIYTKLGISIKEGISKHLWNSRVQSFIKLIRIGDSSSIETYIDACTIALSDFEVLSVDDIRISQTVKRIDQELWNNEVGGINRYPKHIGRNNGGWGAWCHFSLMVAQYYIQIGDKKNADKYLNWILEISYNNELPEHISTSEEFEEYVQDFSQAGILRPDRKIMIDNIRKHQTFKKELAYSVLPLAWAHAQFIIAWNMYAEFKS